MLNEGRQWVFVVGPARSGTTLVTYLICQHPKAFVLLEAKFPLDIFMNLFPQGFDAERVPDADDPEKWHFWTRRFKMLPVHPEMKGFIAPECWETMSRVLGGNDCWVPADAPFWELNPRERAIALTRAMSEAWADTMLSPSVTHFGDKDPVYSRYWYLLREIFPECKIVFTDRDDEEIVDSMMACGFFKDRKYAEVSLREDRKRLPGPDEQPPNSIKMHLGDFDSAKEEQINRLLSFLGLDIDEYPMEEVLNCTSLGKINSRQGYADRVNKDEE